MAGNLDVVGVVGVDVVPVAPHLHERLKAIALPAAQRVGEEAGRKFGDAMSRHITVAIPQAINNGGNAARNASARAGNDNAGAFGRAFKARLEAAFKSLPKPDVRLNDTGLNADLARVRARMETLSNKRIGIDIDEAAALAELEAIDAKLAELGARSPRIQVRSDIATARAQLAEMQRQVNDLDRDDVHIRVRAHTGQAHAALLQLAVAIAAVAAAPLLPIAAAGIGAIASAATVAAVSVGALGLAAVPAIKGVTAAIQAKSAAEKESTSATDNGAAATKRAAQSAAQMVSAQAALRNAHRNAAKQIAQANRAVEDAERALGRAAAQAMEQRRQAAEAVERAEKSLADAKRESLRAEEDLTQARKDAAQQLEDLSDRLVAGKLDERDAALRVQEAQQQLNETLADPASTDLQRARAQLALDEALQGQKEQAKSYKRLQEEAAAAAKAGVEGSDEVKRANEAVADAQRNVQDQTEALADAQRDAAQAQKDAAQSVADAQRAMSDAVENAADAQVSAAESIATAERGVESARLSSIDTTAKAATKADEYREALAKLTPEQRKLYESLAGADGLIPAFKEWSRSLQPDTLPLFTRAVDGAKRALPGLTPLVKGAADGIESLMDRASADLKGDPFWKRFRDGIADVAKPAIEGLGVSFGNVFKGMGGILEAFFPHMDSISERMQGMTKRFAEWGTSLKGSEEFEKFLDYVKELSPLTSEAFKDIAEALFDLGRALKPFSKIFLETLSNAADGISYVSEHAPWAIQLLYGLFVATKLWALAMAMSPVGRIITGLVLLALGVKYAWDHFEWFRTIVKGAWEGIQVATDFAWNKVLKPAFDGIWGGLKWVGDKAMWLWQEVFKPAWDGIVFAAKLAFAILVTAVLTPIWLAIQLVGAIALWLWEDCFKPTWDGISGGAKWLWDNVLKPFFQWVWDKIKWVGDKALWLYNNAVKPMADWIAGKAKWLWDTVLKPVFKSIWDGIKWVGDKFQWLYNHSVKPIADWIADKTGWLWDKALRPAFDKIKEGVSLVAGAFEVAKKGIKGAWDQVAGIAAKPVNFIVDWVYNKGIKAVWDKVADFVGLDPLPKAPKLLDEDPKFAKGGRVFGGTPGKDSVRAWLMPEEFVIRRDSARKLGYGTLEYLNRHGELPGVPKYADGGIVGAFGSAWDWTKDKVSDVVGKGMDWAKTAGDLIANPSKIWSKLMKPVLDEVNDHLGVAEMGKVLAKYPFKMASGLKDKIIDFVTGGGGGGGGDIGGTIPQGERAGIIRAAMAAANVPPPGTVDQWMRGMNTLISRESGWNPRARNNWDINARNGVPSQGLAQTIPPTFNAYVPDTLRSRGILDPVANVAAAIRYIVARYGNITNVQQANANMAPAGYALGGLVKPSWYDDGGYLPPGLSLVANGTSRPEPVFTGSQWDDIRAARNGGPNVQVDVYSTTVLDGQELKGVVDTRIEMHSAETANNINTGRWV